MGHEDYSDAALVLLGHGSTLDAGAGLAVRQHAASLRQTGHFGQVIESFWKEDPRITAVLGDISLPRVFVVPLFVSEGYFSDVVIPRELGVQAVAESGWPRTRKDGLRTITYCQPVGTHPAMGAVILERAREVAARYPFPRPAAPADTALFVAGHGTSRDRNSRQSIEFQVDALRGTVQYAEIHAAFLEEEPSIAGCWRATELRHSIVVPFFIGDGPHVRVDIPVMLGEPERRVRERLERGQATWRNPTERQGRLIWLSASVGTHPDLAKIILARVKEASG